MAEPRPEIVYHASPKDDLHQKGLDPQANPHVTRSKSGWNYLGSYSYVYNQYLKYASPGNYYIYEIDTKGLKADDSPLAGEQQRYGVKIGPERIKKVGTVSTKSNSPAHPQERAYLDWYNKMSKV